MTKEKSKLLAAFIAAIISVVTVMFIVPPVDASAEDGGGIEFTNGTGVEKDPYQISSGEHLVYLAQQINSDTTYTDKYFKLTADIDLTDVKWTPIGTDDNPFTGTFDGGSFTISNLKSTGNASTYAGLFGCNGGTIKNVYLDMVNISTDGGCAAAVCAVNNAGATIEGCAALSGTVDGTELDDTNESGVAGICSKNYGTISKCYNQANVSANRNGAGIAAYIY